MNLTHRHFWLGAAATGLLGLGGCGFTPLYAVPGVSPKLSAIDVSRPDGRTGFLIGQALDNELGRDAGAPTLYRLNMSLRDVRVGRGININNVATEYEVDLTAYYQLRDIKTNALVTKGEVSVNATYNTANQPYASVADELDAERRAAASAAQRIRLDLAAYFASPHPVGTVTAPQLPVNSDFIGVPGAEKVETPRERAAHAADPDVIQLPDSNGTAPPTGGAAAP
ncbi:MAG TPA: LPS assembly lipoprotein LptE [Caulobacteraceae bacterium]|nr:LPS assembly lipoprotein LptE [Caulobacteraceae bacterium]